MDSNSLDSCSRSRYHLSYKNWFKMTDKTDIDNVRYSFETQEFFQRQIEEAINTLINEKNKENNKALLGL